MEARQRVARPGRRRTEHELQSRLDAGPTIAGRVLFPCLFATPNGKDLEARAAIAALWPRFTERRHRWPAMTLLGAANGKLAEKRTQHLYARAGAGYDHRR
jgi:hypothetical protein